MGPDPRNDPEWLNFGDLVVTEDGYHAVVVDPIPERFGITVALCNGLETTYSLDQLRPVMIRGTKSRANFQEWMITSPAWTPAHERPNQPDQPVR